jgi:hypothetical protein
VCNRCWRSRGGGPNRLGNRPRGIPMETPWRIKASFTRVIDPTHQRINFTTLLGRRHPQGSHQRTGPHTGLSLAEEPESRSNSSWQGPFASFFYGPPSWLISFTLICVIRPRVTSPETTRSLALGSFFFNFIISLSFCIFLHRG